MGLLEAGISWLAPPLCVGCGREGRALCAYCAAVGIIPYGEHCWRCGAVSKDCRTCAGCRRGGSPGFVWICTNYENLARDLLRKYKFGHLRAAGEPLAALMSDTFRQFRADGSGYLVVPVPTATTRARARGFDHASLLARHIARDLGAGFCPVLGRVGQASQVGARRAERLVQPVGSYFVKDRGLVRGRKILLIDDVVTTGGTLQAASPVLRQAGAAGVDALIFAKRL